MLSNKAPAPFSSLIVSSPVGPLTLVAGERGLTAVLWENDKAGRVQLGDVREDPGHPVLAEAARQLEEYFARRRVVMDLIDPARLGRIKVLLQGKGVPDAVLQGFAHE